ncbi:MAG: glycosyltransferase [Lachnospiraceae bacterium]|nr:glycosyltransferase [Lachnospiraceae bacterium]
MLAGEMISIIVPLYKGEKYLKRIINQVSVARETIKAWNCNVELVLVNDYPENKIDDRDEMFAALDFTVIVINNSVNQGIHGARVIGINNCHGKYLVMLDQDDYIFPDYLKSQISSIGDCEAVVCRLIHEDREFYNAEYPFDEAMNINYMLNKGCPIVSPGQVMIKKSAIPIMWINNKMINNGADDFLLWLTYLNEGRCFALNQQIVFKHTVEYDNNSWKSIDMLKSEKELIEVLKNASDFAPEYKTSLENLEKHMFTKRINQLDKFKKMFFIYDGIMKAANEGVTVASFLRNNNYKKVAVFGYGYIGKFLRKELEKDEDISLEYVIDRNADYIKDGIPVYKIEEELPEVDCIIISLVQNEETVHNILENKMDAHVTDVKKLLVNMLERDKDAAFKVN